MAEEQNRSWVDRYMLRLPDGMRDRIKAAAEANGRSMNSEIVAILESHLSTSLDVLSPGLQARLKAGEPPLKIWMEHRGLSYVDLSKITGLDRATLAKMRDGRFGNLAMMQKIASALSITVDDLIYNPDF